MTQPFKTYNGGKSANGTYQNIINHIPKCTTFIDAMVGNGGIITNIILPAITVINDIDPVLIKKYKATPSAGLIIENVDVRSLIVKYDTTAPGTFFYFDPPYLKSSRKSQRDLYKFEWNYDDHTEFLKQVLIVKSNCMISHYPCMLYDLQLSDWHKYEFQSITRKGMATEAIYMNYPPPSILQDYRYVGQGFSDRQRIKRKVKRFVNKLDHLPQSERSAIIEAVIKKYSNDASALLK